MDDPQRGELSAESRKSQRNPYSEFRKGPEPHEEVRLLSLSDAERELGLTDYQVYRAVHRREIRVVRVPGKAFRMYLADELEALARRISQGSVLNYEGAA